MINRRSRSPTMGSAPRIPSWRPCAYKAGIKPIFGLEANFCDDRFRRGKDGAEAGSPESGRFILNDYRHLIL
jgi:hypothetical protein